MNTRSKAFQWSILLAVFVPGVIPVYLVVSGRVEGTDPMASLLIIGWTLWALLVIGLSQRVRGLGWNDLGLQRPSSWPRALLQALAIAAVALVVTFLAQRLLIQPLSGAEADISRFDTVRGNLGTLVATILTVWITSAIPEEIIWRGFLMTRVAELLGGSRVAWGAAVVISSTAFGLVHFYQGVPGVLLTGLSGVVFGIGFVVLRNLWPLMMAHALMHVISLTALFLGVL